MAVVESHIDDSYFASGTHKRTDNSALLVDPKAEFVNFGVTVGMLVKNTTDGSEGTITAVTNSTITATLLDAIEDENDSALLDENGESISGKGFWDIGDEYEIYLTGTEDSAISHIYTDKSRGWKVTDPSELNENGWRPEDADLDEDETHIFGPHQPERY